MTVIEGISLTVIIFIYGILLTVLYLASDAIGSLL